MDTILQEAVPKLFGEDVNQKLVRRISKVSRISPYFLTYTVLTNSCKHACK